MGIFITELIRKRNERFLFFATTVLSSLILIILVYIVTGFFIPQTAAAKAISLYNGHVYTLTQVFKIIGSGALGAILILIVLRSVEGPSKIWYWITIISLLISVVYLVIIGQLVSTRYAIVLCSPLILTSTLLLADIRRNAFNFKMIFSIILQILIFILVVIYVFPSTRLSEEKDILKIANYSRYELTNNSRVALTEIGAYGYYSDIYIIDLIGLVDTSTLSWIKEFGRPTNIKELENLLIYRSATHYIDCFSVNEQLNGEKLYFTLLKTVKVTREDQLNNWFSIKKLLALVQH